MNLLLRHRMGFGFAFVGLLTLASSSSSATQQTGGRTGGGGNGSTSGSTTGGGSWDGDPSSLNPGALYKGTVRTTSLLPPQNTTGPIAFTDSGKLLSAIGSVGEYGLQIYRAPDSPATAVLGGVILVGDLVGQHQVNPVRLRFSAGGQNFLTITATKQPLPRLGPPGSPPMGSYEGDYVIYGERLFDYGTATATVNADGTLSFIATGPWLGQCVGGGTLAGSGHLNEAALIKSGTVYGQDRAGYGYSSGTLTLQFNRLPLEPLVLIATLHASGNNPLR